MTEKQNFKNACQILQKVSQLLFVQRQPLKKCETEKLALTKKDEQKSSFSEQCEFDKIIQQMNEVFQKCQQKCDSVQNITNIFTNPTEHDLSLTPDFTILFNIKKYETIPIDEKIQGSINTLLTSLPSQTNTSQEEKNCSSNIFFLYKDCNSLYQGISTNVNIFKELFNKKNSNQELNNFIEKLNSISKQNENNENKKNKEIEKNINNWQQIFEQNVQHILKLEKKSNYEITHSDDTVTFEKIENFVNLVKKEKRCFFISYGANFPNKMYDFYNQNLEKNLTVKIAKKLLSEKTYTIKCKFIEFFMKHDKADQCYYKNFEKKEEKKLDQSFTFFSEKGENFLEQSETFVDIEDFKTKFQNILKEKKEKRHFVIEMTLLEENNEKGKFFIVDIMQLEFEREKEVMNYYKKKTKVEIKAKQEIKDVFGEKDNLHLEIKKNKIIKKIKDSDENLFNILLDYKMSANENDEIIKLLQQIIQKKKIQKKINNSVSDFCFVDLLGKILIGDNVKCFISLSLDPFNVKESLKCSSILSTYQSNPS